MAGRGRDFGAFGGHGPGYMGLAATMWVPMVPKPIPRSTEGFRKESNIQKFWGATKLPKKQEFWF